MAIKTIEYTVDIAGVTPAAEQFAGTQGDHRVAEIVFTISDALYSLITAAAQSGKVMYRFDVYDGEGGIWSSDAAELGSTSATFELEERHTRHGGKITVYLVLTTLSSDKKTEIELYSFPARLRLNNKLDGVSKEGENYESITGLAEVAKANAVNASKSAQAAAQAATSANQAVKQAAEETIILAKTEANRAEEAAAGAKEAVKQAVVDAVALAEAEAQRAVQAADTAESVVNQVTADVLIQAEAEVEKAAIQAVSAAESAQNAKDTLNIVAEFKSLSGKNIIALNESKTISHVKLITDAPQNTKVRIFNENCVEDENCAAGTTAQTVSANPFQFTIVNCDSASCELDLCDIKNFGEFVFNNTVNVPDEYGVYMHSLIRISSPSLSLDIPLKNLEVGSTYLFIAMIEEESVLVSQETFEYIHTFDKIYLLNKTKSVVETVNADGTISTANIKPYTVAMLDDLTTTAAYNFNLYYVVSNFATKQYVDNAINNIDVSGSVDQTYSAESKNAQSGIAVAEALKKVDLTNYVEKIPDATGYTTAQVYANKHNYATGKKTVQVDNYNTAKAWHIPTRNIYGGIYIPDGAENDDNVIPSGQLAVNRNYVDDLVGDIESALDELHNYAQALINGGAE